MVVISIIGFLNYQKLYSAFVPVKPVVTSINTIDNSTLLDYRISVQGYVSNRGGAGDAVLTIILTQGPNNYEKNTTLSLPADGGANFNIDFPEVGMFKGDISYKYRIDVVGKRR